MYESQTDSLTGTLLGDYARTDTAAEPPVPQVFGLRFPTRSPPRLDHLVVMRRDDLPATATPIMASYPNHLTILAAGAFIGGALLIGILGLALYIRQRRRWQRQQGAEIVVQADLDCPKVISTNDQALLMANEEPVCEEVKQLTSVLEAVEEQSGRTDQRHPCSEGFISNTWQLHRSTSWPGDVAEPSTSTGHTPGSVDSASRMSNPSRTTHSSCRDNRSDSWPGLAVHTKPITSEPLWSQLPATTYISRPVIPSSSGDSSTRHDVLAAQSSSATDTSSFYSRRALSESPDLSDSNNHDLTYQYDFSRTCDFTSCDMTPTDIPLSQHSVNRNTGGSSLVDEALMCYASNER